MAKEGAGIARLLEIMACLRDPETGCPWDVRQTFQSIAPYTVEEAYEVADAIRRGDVAELRDELGDLLLQVVYHAQIASEAGHFGFAEVVAGVSDKMVRRHPHVFGDAARPETFDAADWEREKERERGRRSALDGAAAPDAPLARAMTLGQRAARVGFDWDSVEGAYRKLAEEIGELRASECSRQRRDEFGDLLFAAVSLARHLGIDPEAALRRANDKFERRFRAMEISARNRGERLADLDANQLDDAWTAAKAAVSVTST